MIIGAKSCSAFCVADEMGLGKVDSSILILY